MLSEVPNGWETVKLGDVTYITKLAGYEYTKHITYDNTSDIIAIRGLNIKSGCLNLANIKRIPSSVSDELPRSKLFVNDMVMSYVGTIGEVALIPEDNKFHLAPNVALVRSGETILPHFLLSLFQSPLIEREIKRETSQTSQASLSMTKIRSFNLILPPLPEQKKIAEVLGTVDQAIAATEAVIAQTRRVKQGLLTDLLTRGIGHTKFKQTEIGQIPESWEVVKIRDLGTNDRPAIKAGPFGSALKKEYYSTSGYKIYGQENVIKGSLSYGDYYINDDIFSKLSSCVVQQGDLLVSLVGTFGKTLLVDETAEQGIINPRLIRLTLNPVVITSKFMQTYLESPLTQHAMRINSQGGTMGVLNGKIIGGLSVPIPSLNEQDGITSLVSKLNFTLDAEQTKLDQLKRVKKGLMADLLTGKIRVTV